MSSAAIKWARAQRMPSGPLTTMLAAIASRADHAGMTFASQTLFAKDMGYSDRTVRKLLWQLEYLGVIKRHPRSNGKTGRSSDRLVMQLDQQFSLSKADLPSNRKKLPEAKFQPEIYDLATGTRLPGNNINNNPPYHGEGFSLPIEGTYTREEERYLLDAGDVSDWLPDEPATNVVPFKRGAA